MATKIPYKHFDLKEQSAGSRIEITLSAVANVRLMNSTNFRAYKDAIKHQFIGGVARKSPIVLAIPQAGHWHVVIDAEGHHGLAEASIKLIHAPKPARKQAPQKPAARNPSA